MSDQIQPTSTAETVVAQANLAPIVPDALDAGDGAGVAQPSPGTGAATPAPTPEAGAAATGTLGGGAAAPSGDEGDTADGDAEPRRLIDEGLLEGEAFGATTATATPAPLVLPTAAMPLPEPGERVVVDVPGGAEVRLEDQAFDPTLATYAVDGDDLVVTLVDGGIVVLNGFFVGGDNALSVLEGPLVASPALLQQAESAPVLAEGQAVQPAAEGPQQDDGGGAGFRAYDPGSIGAGLVPLGPLGPTSLAYATPSFEGVRPFGAEDDDDGAPGGGEGPGDGGGPVGGIAPTIALASRIDGEIVDQGGPPFAFPDRPDLPIRGEGQPVPEAQINGVDQANLTLDAPREVEVTLLSESSRSVDSLLVYDVGDDGALTNVRTVFAGMNTPDQVHFEPGQSTPGTSASLGVVGAGTQLGFVLVNDAGRDYGDLFASGRFELRSGEGAGVAKNTDEAPPRLIHLAPDGTETVVDERLYFTADDSQDTDNNNALHPDGLGHLVSGVEGNSLVIGFEDGEGPANRLGTGYDRDFNDAVIAVTYGEPADGGDRIVRLDMDLAAQIADPDSTTMREGVVLLAEGEAGDRLRLPDGVLDGTNITAERVGTDRIEFTGADSIANYEKVMGAVNLVLDPNDPQAGARTIEANVTDDGGLESNNARTTIAITAPDGDGMSGGDGGGTPGDGNGDGGPVGGVDDCVPLTLIGGNGADGFVGSSPCDDTLVGNGGDDYLRGRSGDDVLRGGPGDDYLSGGPGNDRLDGGPGADRLHPGEGADTVKAGAGDRVYGFDPAAGDRLELGDIFQGGGLRFERFAAGDDGAANDAKITAKGGAEIVFVGSPNVVSPASLGLEPPQHSDGATS